MHRRQYSGQQDRKWQYGSIHASVATTLNFGFVKYLYKTGFAQARSEMLEVLSKRKASILLEGTSNEDIDKMLAAAQNGARYKIMGKMSLRRLEEYSSHLKEKIAKRAN